ncbi:unnamed protein product, partial [Brugia timori]|uniref:Uncharacterized protein n=1 Tax=Brugia timori TaxID=42155 RepID=A0A0R3R8X6_9BILA
MRWAASSITPERSKAKKETGRERSTDVFIAATAAGAAGSGVGGSAGAAGSAGGGGVG